MTGDRSADKARVALVTGGSGAIGAEVCTGFARIGYDVAFTYRSNRVAAEKVRDEVLAIGRRCLLESVDLAARDDVAAFVNSVSETLGGVDALVHAAGPYPPQRYLGTVEPEVFARHVDQELIGFFTVATLALPHLRERRGSLTAVTTFAVRSYPPRDGLSSAPKAGVEGVVRALAAEEGRFGVRANCVGPGILADGLATALTERGDFDDAARKKVVQRIPLQRFGRATEVADAVVFLGSDRASYISGQSLDVDGGYGV
ncbi:3-oxoacyl-[acyl-carrier-protein] reductase [Pseudonocardia ailaonensis]|uniref:3-oxoacyl-[acyl-carrier-protein] reductase n=1 Tax=Pseudonocardia ailaonensis TaxID=367279 RepID=A0ABN2N3W2_9PSEU